MFDRLNAFLGKHLEFDGVKIYSPTIDDISDIGEGMYNTHYSFATFDLETILIQLFGVTEQEYEKYANSNPFEFLTSKNLNKYLCDALSFFTKSEVTFNEEDFYSNSTPFLNTRNFVRFTSTLRVLNGQNAQKEEIRFKNEKSKSMFTRLQELRKKYKKTDSNSLELKDILSILCVAEGNGVNIFNVGQLSIYQVYALFERLNLKESHNRILPIWANGHLKESDKLPEWIIKSTL